MSENKVILVWRSAALGDFILCTPALKILRDSYPDHKIVFLTISSSDPTMRKRVSLYSGGSDKYPWINFAMPHLIDEVISLPSLSLKDVFRASREVAKFNIDFSIIMTDPCAPYIGRIKKLLLLIVMTRSMRIYGWKGKGSTASSFKGREKLKSAGLLKHHVYGAVQFARELGLKKTIEANELKIDLRIPEYIACNSEQIFHRLNIDSNQKYVVIAPGSVQPHKTWPTEKYCSLILRILETYDVRILILGAKGDHDKSEVMAALCPTRVINLCGKTTVYESGLIFSKSSLVVGNDGGAIHLADAFSSNVISIIPGLEYPNSIEPWGNISNSIRHHVECAPCYSFTFCPKGNPVCINDISLDAVWSKVVKLMRRDVIV